MWGWTLLGGVVGAGVVLAVLAPMTKTALEEEARRVNTRVEERARFLADQHLMLYYGLSRERRDALAALASRLGVG